MNNLTLPEKYLSADQHRLLGGWRDILDDIRALCRALAELPDVCQCGNGTSHLQGQCPCCHSAAADSVPDCGDCEAQLARLRPAMDTLTVDSGRFFPGLNDVLARAAIPDAIRAAHEIEIHTAAVVRSFGQLVVAADQFKTDCRSSHLKTLKEAATVLLREAELLNHVL